MCVCLWRQLACRGGGKLPQLLTVVPCVLQLVGLVWSECCHRQGRHVVVVVGGLCVR